MRVIDDPCTGDLPVGRSSLWLSIWTAFAVSIRNRFRRRQVARLEHMSDFELYDIGLTRSDLQSALGESRFFEDPSRRLRRTRLPRD